MVWEHAVQEMWLSGTEAEGWGQRERASAQVRCRAGAVGEVGPVPPSPSGGAEAGGARARVGPGLEPSSIVNHLQSLDSKF